MSRIITVSREFGSGGRELGKRLADALGYAYYDREIVSALAERTGMDENYLEHELERSTVSPYPIHFAQSFTEIPDASIGIRSLQTRLIRELAESGNCVFVGRAADSILEEMEPFKLFVCADEQSKLARCRARASASENFSDREMLRQMKRIDRNRAEYHDIISSYTWGDRTAYHLCVNTSGLVIKEMIPALAAYYREWLNAHAHC